MSMYKELCCWISRFARPGAEDAAVQLDELNSMNGFNWALK